jgi:hypothetical protein
VRKDAPIPSRGRTRAPGPTDVRSRGRLRRLVRPCLAACVVSCLCALGRPASAQESPAIRGAVRLAAEGRGDSARRIVAAELARARPGDAAYVEALFWRGRLATSGDSAAHDFRRVAIEYSTSRWADQALLQLAQLAMAAGKPAEALEDARRIRSDYPHSALGSPAAMWAGRAAFEIGDPVTACALLDSAKQEAAGDIELVNQIAYYRGRCPAALSGVVPAGQAARADTAAARSDTVRRRAPTPAAATPAATPTQFEVQVTATRSGRAARAMLERVKKTGLSGHIVAGADGYQRVRAGPFRTRREADAAADRLRRALGGHPLVVSLP